jgi:hypothetical protein
MLKAGAVQITELCINRGVEAAGRFTVQELLLAAGVAIPDEALISFDEKRLHEDNPNYDFVTNERVIEYKYAGPASPEDGIITVIINFHWKYLNWDKEL